MASQWRGLIEEYRSFLDLKPGTRPVTLLEGGTPLIEARNLSAKLGGGLRVFLKFEGCNPTGSFKDRGMTMAITKAVEDGSKMVMCASTGNTSASAAAYSAQAGLKCFVILPHNAIAMGKLAQALMHGARVLAIEGNFDQALEIVQKITSTTPGTMVNSSNPWRLQGQKTAAFEIIDCLGDAPEYHAIPVGNAGNITAYWMGYNEYKAKGFSKRLPKMCGFQAAGSAPIVEGHPIADPHTVATAIKIGNPYSWKKAEEARDQSGGVIEAVTDDEILDAYNLLAACEGVFCEPASAASVAGVIKKHKAGYFTEGERRVVCTLTGHGLKDPDNAIKRSPKPTVLKPDLDAIRRELGL